MKHFIHPSVLQDYSSLVEPIAKEELMPANFLEEDTTLGEPSEEDELRPVSKGINAASRKPEWILAKTRQYYGVDASVVGWIARSASRTRSCLHH